MKSLDELWWPLLVSMASKLQPADVQTELSDALVLRVLHVNGVELVSASDSLAIEDVVRC